VTPSPPPPLTPVQYFRTLTGRLFILTSVLSLAFWGARLFVALPLFLSLLEKVAHFAWIVAAVVLAVRAIAQNRRRFLWRVRQRLILSYLFLGFMPVLLVLALTLVGGLGLYMNVTGYMFHEGFQDFSGDVQQAAETTAAEIESEPAASSEAVTRKYKNLSSRYPALSLTVVPLSVQEAGAPTAPSDGRNSARRPVAGPWRHTAVPTEAPEWLANSTAGFRGVIAVPTPGASGDWMLVIRAVAPTRDHSRAVIADLPVDSQLVTAIEDRTKVRMGQFTVEPCGGPADVTAPAASQGVSELFRHSVVWIDCTNWKTGVAAPMFVSLEAPLSRLYGQVSAFRAGQGDFTIVLIPLLAILFIIMQGSALFIGILLARSITYAVHELSVATEQIQRGNFSHRIRIDSDDQLGDLASNHNRMSSSIEHLLHVQREKQRLDDELRIAREIQKSLLPVSPPSIPGMTIADLCEPAREVGGDYYDFFQLGPRRLGVMVADVSGKGTSAALYMAELKGLMLALTRAEESPKRLLIEANRLLAEHLDNRSFITMTYAIIDLDAGSLICARAGHTPLIVVSGGDSQIITPSGMVLGLRLPGAAERFAQVLDEHTHPIRPGDLIVLYTDGITEAMNEAGDLFSDEALARVVADQHELDAAGIRERVVREVRSFVGSAEPHDDMTMIVLKIDKEGTEKAEGTEMAVLVVG
jgi:serine phosphatase RsbU (regulator of sigma subunit)